VKITRIIIVDDHEIVRDGLIAMFYTIDNVEVIGEAGDADSLLKLLSETIPDFLLLDISLPGMSGIEIAKKIRNEYPGIKILMLSADGCRKNVLDALHANVHGFILKNSGKETLLQAIRVLNRNERFFGHEISQTLINEFFQNKDSYTKTDNSLSDRETEILQLIARGLSHKQIAEKTFISKRTVDTHVNNIMMKLDIHNRAGLVIYAFKNCIVQL
jgi:two-component system, NarL family, nitrate/nitrite response regulator NarL